jgi:hypothetical protein
MTHFMISEDGLSFEEVFPPEPGERCVMCHRRLNRKKTDESPAVKEVRFRAPPDVIEAIEEQFDTLQEYTGVDPYGFPRARLLEALLLLGIQEREDLKAHFNGDRGAL